MSGFSKEKALEFAKLIQELAEALPVMSNNGMARAVGLDSDGMNAVLTILSTDIISDVRKGGDGFAGMAQMFSLGINVGRLFGRQEKESIQ